MPETISAVSEEAAALVRRDVGQAPPFLTRGMRALRALPANARQVAISAIRPDSAVWGTVLSVAGFLAAAVGSIFSSDIKDAISAYLRRWDWGTPLLWFALLFATTALLFFVRQHVIDRNRRLATESLNQSANSLNRKSDMLVEKTEEIIARSDTLTRLVRTLPPPDFLFAFQHLYAQSFLAWRDISGTSPATSDQERVRQTIRIVLRSLVSLTRKFDGGEPEMIYAANIMHFVPFEEIRDGEESAIRARLKFMDDRAFTAEELLGVLDLELELSTYMHGSSAAAGTDMFPSDDRLLPLALPIPAQPRTDNGAGDWRVLPGGPIAFVDRVLNVQSDIEKLKSWCQTEADFHRSTLKELDRHFNGEASERVKSFAALPLIPMNADRPVGVLNLHCSHPGLFENTQPAEHFIAIVQPFQLMLAELVKTLQSLRSPP